MVRPVYQVPQQIMFRLLIFSLVLNAVYSIALMREQVILFIMFIK